MKTLPNGNLARSTSVKGTCAVFPNSPETQRRKIADSDAPMGIYTNWTLAYTNKVGSPIDSGPMARMRRGLNANKITGKGTDARRQELA
jgi:hypothetical protein